MVNIHVSKTPISGFNTGGDWENAFLDLDTAMTYANSIPNTSGIVNIYIDYDEYDMSTFTMTREFNIIGSAGPWGNLNKTVVNMDSLSIDLPYADSRLVDITIQNLYLIGSGNGYMFDVDSPDIYLRLWMNYNVVNGSSYMTSSSFPYVSQTLNQISVVGTGMSGYYNNIITTNSHIYADTGFVAAATNNIAIVNTKIIADDAIVTPITTISGQIYNVQGCTIKGDVSYYDKTLQTANIITSTIDGDLSSGTGLSGNYMIANSILLGSVLNGTNMNKLDYWDNAYLYLPPSADGSSGNKQLTKRPIFKNEDLGDYTVLHGYGETLESFELMNSADTHIFNERSQKIGNTRLLEPFNYKFGNAITLSDYGQEILFAETLNKNKFDNSNNSINYDLYYKQIHIIENAVTKPSFQISERDTITEDWPYEWDYVEIETPNIEKVTYIIPKSIVDVTDIINSEFATSAENVSISKFTIDAVKSRKYSGVTFDYELSGPTTKIVWTIDEQNNLTATNVYNGTIVAKYPLFSKKLGDNEQFIKPSGLIKYARTEGGYNYILESDPNTIITGETDDYDFRWLPTELDTKYDVGGLLAYKGNLFVGVKYTNSDESSLLVYPSRGQFDTYVYDHSKEIQIPESGIVPSDLTILEDGTLLIADANNSHINRYQPMYDYALLSSAGTSDTKILLKEQYDNITI